jgi:hypothetical protein
MSRRVILSDTFNEQLHDLLLAAMRYVQRPNSTERHHDYTHAALYEYDTDIQHTVRHAVAMALTEDR